MPSSEREDRPVEHVTITHKEKIVRGDGTTSEIHLGTASSTTAAELYGAYMGMKATQLGSESPKSDEAPPRSGTRSGIVNNFDSGKPSIFEEMRKTRLELDKQERQRQIDNSGNN